MSQFDTHYEAGSLSSSPAASDHYEKPSPAHKQNGAENKKADVSNGVDKLAYTDDDADVALKSTDGRVFKVHSYLLKAQG